MGTAKKAPWWATDPELQEFLRQSYEEFEREVAAREPVPADLGTDPVIANLLSGASLRELAHARDDLKRAQERYGNAVLAGRKAGLSWGEIGEILGVSKQKLHSRYRSRDLST